jgi:catechol 2,3-dioxygenase-like lactoylglutathione lyase family enzyme
VKVKGIRWIGVGTPEVARMRSFAVDVLGMQVVGQDTEEFVELAMGDGSKLELFGSAAAADGPWLFESNPVVAGFLVDDIELACAELLGHPVSNSWASFASWRTDTRGSTFAPPTATSTSSRWIPPLAETRAVAPLAERDDRRVRGRRGVLA